MWASHCCGTTWPSAPTACRATRTQARSTTLARLANKPVLGHASAWSPKASTVPPQPGLGPHLLGQSGRASRKRRRNATSMGGGCLSRDGSEPHAGLRTRLRAEKRLGARRQCRHQHAIAIEVGLNPRRMALPAVWPLARTCLARRRCALALQDRAPRGTVGPPFALQGLPGRSCLL